MRLTTLLTRFVPLLGAALSFTAGCAVENDESVGSGSSAAKAAVPVVELKATINDWPSHVQTGEGSIRFVMARTHPEQVLEFEIWELAATETKQNAPLTVQVQQCRANGSCSTFPGTLRDNHFTPAGGPSSTGTGDYYVVTVTSPADYETRRISLHSDFSHRGLENGCKSSATAPSFDACGAGLYCVQDPTNAEYFRCKKEAGGKAPGLSAPGNLSYSSDVACGNIFTIDDKVGIGAGDHVVITSKPQYNSRKVEFTASFHHATPQKKNERPQFAVSECDTGKTCQAVSGTTEWSGDGKESMRVTWTNTSPRVYLSATASYRFELVTPAGWEARKYFSQVSCWRGPQDHCDANGGCDGTLQCKNRPGDDPALNAKLCLP